MYKVYGTPSCPYCLRAKQLLEERGIEYEYTDLAENDELREKLASENNHYTVPMIFKGDEFIGGFDNLSEKDANGEL